LEVFLQLAAVQAEHIQMQQEEVAALVAESGHLLLYRGMEFLGRVIKVITVITLAAEAEALELLVLQGLLVLLAVMVALALLQQLLEQLPHTLVEAEVAEMLAAPVGLVV
jgi:hypothetical protein